MKKFLITTSLLCAAAHAEFRLPQYEALTLNNGLTVYLMEQHEVPLVAISAVSKRGAAHDKQHAGLASLTAEALLDGSAKYTKQAIAETFDFRGADIRSGVDLDATVLSAQWTSKAHAELIPVFVNVLTQPQFPQTEFDKLRELREQALKQAKESPRQVIGDYYRQHLFGGSDYGQAVDGTPSSVAQLTREQVAAFYAAHYCPSEMAITVVGDFDRNKMRNDIKKQFGSWKKNCATGTVEVKRNVVDKARVLLVNKDDANETTFMIGQFGVTQNDADMTQLSVINTILGGRFTSWLNDELRVNSGLTYGARSSFNALKNDGVFVISSFTAQKNTEAALKLAIETYQRLWTKGIDEETLASAKAYVKGLYPPQFETPAQLSSLLGDMYVYGFGRERIDGFAAAVDSLTVARCKELIAKHFHRDQLQMTLVGKADAIRDIAKQFGDVSEVDINAE